jgi:LysM repeat protein
MGGKIMALILRHELLCEQSDCTVILHIDPQTSEFSKEFDGCCNPMENKTFIELIQCYVKANFPEINITLVKIMIGSVVVATVSFSGITTGDHTVYASTYYQTAYTSYSVAAGDSLWVIATKFKTTINDIKAANNLTSDMLMVGQVLKIPQQSATYTTYKVTAGDSLYIISRRFNVSISALKSLNGLTTETINIGQILKIPTSAPTTAAPSPSSSNYTVASGDTLWKIASKYNTTVANLKAANNLSTDMLYIGQVLKVPTGTVQTPTAPNLTSQAPSVSYITHKVVAGDNPWNLSIKYGIPMAELLNVNGFTQSTQLNIGQEIKIPVHNIPVKPTPGPEYGERLDWWLEAQYVFPINKTAKVTDFSTGLTFYIKRTTGAFHADCEPLTSTDSAVMKQIWGGAYAWTTRAVIVEVDGRKIAASMSSMPHDIEYIASNDFNGHFDLHFFNSTRHRDNLIDPYHQTQINIAAGYTQK